MPLRLAFLIVGSTLVAFLVGFKMATMLVRQNTSPSMSFLDGLSRLPIWKFDKRQYDKETKKGVWNFMDEDDNERSRHAIVGGVYIRNHAPPNGSILDIGCATGTLSDFLIPTQTYEGYDLGCEAIQKGLQKRPTVNLTCADAATLTPSRTLYDVIVFNEMLYFVDVRAVIERYRVLLRPKTGFIMVSLFKFLQLKGKKMMKEDFARENITAIVHALLKPVNKVEIIGDTFDGKASWCIEMLRLA